MNISTITKTCRQVALGAVVSTIGAAAWASPAFTVNPGYFGSGAADFDADFISGTSSTLLTLNAGTAAPGDETVAGSGWIQFGQFNLVGQNLAAGDTRLTVDYNLFATYSYTTLLISGGLGDPGSNYVVTSLIFNLYGEARQGSMSGLDTSFVQASVTPATAATAALSADAQLLGTGNLLGGAAGINIAGGTSFTTAASFGLTAAGSGFFVAPVPFFDIVFDSFTNTQPGVTRNGNLIAVNNASGGVDFGRLPEPASLALAGIALLAAAGFSRRKA